MSYNIDDINDILPSQTSNSGKFLQTNGTVSSWNSISGSATLTNTHIYVGNGSNLATDVAMSGDATMANTGALTLATVSSTPGTFGSASKTVTLTTTAKGLTTASAQQDIAITESQVTNLVSDLAAKQSTTLTNGSILIGNGSNVATANAVTGDVLITNAGVTSINTGVIVNADVNASAAIDYSKLASLTSAHILVGSAGNVATDVAVTGDIGLTNGGVTSISSGVIVNSDVNASAAIDFSKLASLTSANLILGSAGNVPTATAVTGDVTISNTGVTAIGSGVIVNGDVNASAAIARSKLSALTASKVMVTDGSGFDTTANPTVTEINYVAGVTSAIQTQLDSKVGTTTITSFGAAAWTPTGTWSTNTTYLGQYRRVGDSGEFRVKVTLSGAPTSANLDINLPASHTIDTTKLTGNTVDLMIMGQCTIEDNSTGVQYIGIVTYASTTTVGIQVGFIDSHTGTANVKYNDVSQSNPVTFANADIITISFSAPIVEYA